MNHKLKDNFHRSDEFLTSTLIDITLKANKRFSGYEAYHYLKQQAQGPGTAKEEPSNYESANSYKVHAAFLPS